jgi:hypothetical protein
MLRRVALVRTDVSEKRKVCIIRVTRFGDQGTSEGTSNRSTLRRNAVLCCAVLCCAALCCAALRYATVFFCNMLRLLVKFNIVLSSPILAVFMMEAMRFPKRLFLQEPHSLTPHKTESS